MCGLNLYEESRLRIFKVGEYQFVIEEHPTEEFNSVAAWLQANYFSHLVPIFESKQIKTLHQMVKHITQSDLVQIGLEPKEIQRYISLVDLMKRISKINLH